MQKKVFTSVIVEDEKAAQVYLTSLIDTLPWLKLVGTFASGLKAKTFINKYQPDLVFLDIKLPDISGIDILAGLNVRPYTVFTTAYDQYAVLAFELSAIDYLLKPFSQSRFHTAMERVLKSLMGDNSSFTDEQKKLLENPSETIQVLFVKHAGQTFKISIEDVQCFRSCEDYVEVVLDGSVFLIRCTLKNLLMRLNQSNFIQIHRSTIINLEKIISLKPIDSKRLIVTLNGGTEVIASQAGSKVLRKISNKVFIK